MAICKPCCMVEAENVEIPDNENAFEQPWSYKSSSGVAARPADADASTFTIELTKTPESIIGLDIDWGDRKTLKIYRVREDSLVAEWNLKHPDKVVQGGDFVIKVNDASGSSADIMEEIKRSTKLLVTIMRHSSWSEKRLRPGCRCIDCGFVLSETATSWPTCKPLTRELLKTPQTSSGPGARNKQAFALNGGMGTHIDSPSHFVPNGRTVDMLGPEELAGIPVAVVDISKAIGDNADYACTAQDVLDNESAYGRIPNGALVCIRTGWAESRYKDTAAYYNVLDPNDQDSYTGLPRMHFPGLAVDAANLLVEYRKALGVGIDTLSPDPGASGGFDVHNLILGADKYILENLRLTEEVPPRGAIGFVSPLNVAGAPEAPCRLWVMVDD